MTSGLDRAICDGVVRQSYERLLLNQPHLNFDGLWLKDGIYYIVCPDLGPDTKSKDGTALEDWFRSHEIMGPPTEFARTVPDRAEQIVGRSAEDLALLRHSSRTFPEIVLALNLALPREFPNFELDDAGGESSAIFERELSTSEKSIFLAACQAVGVPRIGHTSIDSTRDYRGTPFLHVYGPKIGDAGTDLYLTPTRRLSTAVPQKLRWMVEDDEDFWRDRRVAILGTGSVEQPDEVLPATWKTSKASCIVDPRAYPTSNIRNYLTVFKHIVLVLPTADQLEVKLQELRISRRDLIDLVRIGRVSLLLPESIDRYTYAILEPLAEEAPQRLLPSRRLAALTIVDARRRFPFFYPALSVEERYHVLHWLTVAAEHSENDDVRRFHMAAIEALGDAWDAGEVMIHHSGGAATSLLGVGGFCSELLKASVGGDHWFDCVTAAAGVEWAGALGASIASSEAQEPYTDLVASYYSRLHTDGVPTVRPEVHTIIKRVLVLNDDAPVVPFATAFSSSDIERFHDCVQNLAKWNADPHQLEQAIERFNDNVRALERLPHKLVPMDIVALAPTVAGVLGVVPGGVAGWITLGMWVMRCLMPFLGNNMARRSRVISKLFDRANGVLTRSEPDAVLVARLRKQARQ